MSVREALSTGGVAALDDGAMRTMSHETRRCRTSSRHLRGRAVDSRDVDIP